MKLIILSAFNGRLVSEPIEWSGEPLSIRLAFNNSLLSKGFRLGKDIESVSEFHVREALFEPTGYHVQLDSGLTAAIYEMVSC